MGNQKGDVISLKWPAPECRDKNIDEKSAQ
jgi:hypothetical protein